MIGTSENMPNAEKRDLFVSDEVNVFRLHGLNPESEVEADRVIHETGFILKRPLPPPRCFGSLYRKYYKVKNSDTTYAFGILEENRKEVRGTQGWSVQMALQLQKNVYVYDDKTRQWYKGDQFEARLPSNNNNVADINRFKPCDPPTLAQKSNITLPTVFGIHTSEELEKLPARRS